MYHNTELCNIFWEKMKKNSKRENWVVVMTVYFKNKTGRIDIQVKIRSYSIFGQMNPNIILVFAFVYSIVNFRIDRYRKCVNAGNTEAMIAN